MKTLHTIRQLALVTCLSMLTMAATGQQNTRQDRRNGSERNSTRTEASQRTRDNSKARPANDKTNRPGRDQYTRNGGRTSYESKGNQNYKRDHQNNKRDEANYKKDDRQHGHYNKPQTGRKPASAQVHYSAPRPSNNRLAYVRHIPHRHDTHFRHLPTQRVNKFHYNGYDYYHSNNHFYKYHPQHGYRIVEAPYSRVRYLPARYQLRVINGHPYP
ncbi:MAG: hypothetical protein LC643_03550, partial [Bacteroidales bacterium]|nr:hypothetical protein [Bacteroidales bacterium]